MSEDKDKEQYGVLLYYNYAEISDLNHLLTFYHSNCTSLNLRGRVRLSTHGVNVTVSNHKCYFFFLSISSFNSYRYSFLFAQVGGNLSSLESHIEALKAYNSLFHRTDFKLATCHHPLNDKVAQECGFTSLSIRIVDELVTLSSHPLLKAPDISNAGSHLSALDFHSSLHNASKFL